MRAGLAVGVAVALAATLTATVPAAAAVDPAPGTIVTVMGDGTTGAYSSTRLKIRAPRGVAVDRAGNRYFSGIDSAERIMKVDNGGVLSELCSACGGWGLAVDDSGNVFTTSGNYVRRVTPGGAVTPVAGNGNEGSSGDGGPATSARLKQPTGVSVDTAGNVYIADSGNNRVRRVTPGGTIDTVASFASLRNVAVDRTGLVYVAAGNQVSTLTAAGVTTPIAGTGEAGFSGDGGQATNARLNTVTAVAVDDAGTLWVADEGNRRIRKVEQGVITTVAGNGTAGYGGDYGAPTSAALGATVRGIGVNRNGTILSIGDGDNHRLRVVSDNAIWTFAGTGVPGDEVSTPLTTPVSDAYDLAFDSAGNMYVADTYHYQVVKITPDGMITNMVGAGRRGFSGDGGPAAQAEIDRPYAIAVDGAGAVYIATEDSRVRKIAVDGVISTVAGTGEYGLSGDGGPATAAAMRWPMGLALDAAGNLFIADTGNDRVRKVTSSGTITTVAGTVRGNCGDGGPATAGCLASPSGLALDGSGALYIADYYNNQIRRVGTDGVLSTVAGRGAAGDTGDGGPATAALLNMPYAVEVDGGGNLLIADSGNSTVRQIRGDGKIRRVAGVAGSTTYGGDNGPATAAQMYWPEGIAVGPGGHVYVSDSANHRIRKIIAPF